MNLTFKRLANDKVPESCRGVRNGALEALTGLRKGQVLSSERINPDVHAVGECAWGQHLSVRNGESAEGLAESKTLCECASDNLRENREILCPTCSAMLGVRVAKPIWVRR